MKPRSAKGQHVVMCCRRADLASMRLPDEVERACALCHIGILLSATGQQQEREAEVVVLLCNECTIVAAKAIGTDKPGRIDVGHNPAAVKSLAESEHARSIARRLNDAITPDRRDQS